MEDKYHMPPLIDPDHNYHEKRIHVKWDTGCLRGLGTPADFFNTSGRHGAMVLNCCGSHYPFGLHLVWDGISAPKRTRHK
jgi:hypothetical protein